MRTPAVCLVSRFVSCLTGSALALLAGCAATPAPRQLELTLDVATERPFVAAEAEAATRGLSMHFNPRTLVCRGAGDYQDLVPGAEVVVRDERGQAIGRARLGQGRVIEHSRDAAGQEIFQGCRFALTIPLAKPARIYTIELDEGEFRYHYHVVELHRRGGQLLLSLE